MPDMLIPFIMLLIITIGLILERRHHEAKIVDIYEEKYENWKKHATLDSTEKPKCKELVGLVFKEDSKINIETFDDNTKDKLERKKYTIS
jgi:hypothetical protein